ncbi:TIM-barrel domain-containing protein [Anaeromicrobium sediminis]|uniref:Alpha-glucosidase n=1 Tax=Anaeromicrobium sediminis TaxID=1478221 RepID=A0A267MJC0_9FIRM|nr:TIM-barrel domain-containing protein [Anaeromicrobium sediminis]PAB59694.1 alpha-glucosidase [Anaeromicrobium sediminis]
MKAYKIDEKIIRYTFGKPVNTDAVVVSGKEIDKKEIPYVNINCKENLLITYKMDDSDIVYGLGQNQRGINKRGGIYESFCSDDPNHTPNKKSLYGAHNFIIVEGREKFGMFIDYPGKVKFDIGFTHKENLEISLDDNNVHVYIIEGENSKAIVKSFLNIIGRGYVPPKWAFGYQQCRWSYEDNNEIEEVANKFIENNIPCDTIYLDIDYMERYKDFTVSDKAFPDFSNFVKKMKDKGFRLIPIIDAGVKIEEGYEVYEEGIKNNYFCTDENGKPFVAAVWPGKVHFPDFLNKDTRLWFGLKYKTLVDCGIEGFWNDMNEPAIFYTERGIKEAIDKAKESEGKNLDIDTFFGLMDTFRNVNNNDEDYKAMYHNMDGKRLNHYDVHNLYGYNMTRSAAEGFEHIDENKRFLMFSRSSYIGMHRYSGIWTGDNHSWWDHILLNLKMMPSLSMCGLLYSGADTGGFSEDANSQLLIRWNQFSMFTPLYRNHAAKGTRRQEPYAFEEETKDILKNMIEIRYSLIPYIYSEYMKAILNRDMYFMPLSFVYGDAMSKRVENQLLLGDSLMVAPVYEENSLGRYVYLPEDMLLWKARRYDERSYEVMKKGHAYIDVPLEEAPIFIRKNKMLVLGNPAKNVDSMDNSSVHVIAFVEHRATYTLYDDDGLTKEFKEGKYSEIEIVIEKKDEDFEVTIENFGNEEIKTIKFEIIDMSGNVIEKTVEV